MDMNSSIKICVLFLALLAGAGAKLYLGTVNPVEPEIETVIESVTKDMTGVDLTPILS